jgi:hypothetical protein
VDNLKQYLNKLDKFARKETKASDNSGMDNSIVKAQPDDLEDYKELKDAVKDLEKSLGRPDSSVVVVPVPVRSDESN